MPVATGLPSAVVPDQGYLNIKVATHLLTSLSPGINTYPLIMGIRHFGKQKQVLRRKSVAPEGCYSDSERKKRHEASG
ncbi:MAG TPA: hypothetical protein VMX96_03620, partial [Dehalococcoidia bacterium]|nr:hypothetical protein [Dehalococcoidia bacterium]